MKKAITFNKAVLAALIGSLGLTLQASAQTPPAAPVPAVTPAKTPAAAPKSDNTGAPDQDDDNQGDEAVDYNGDNGGNSGYGSELTTDGTISPTPGMPVSNAEAKKATPIPHIELTSELLFKLMASEIAFRRGEWQTAFATELDLARTTKDPGVAERATDFAIGAKQLGPALLSTQEWLKIDPESVRAQQIFLELSITGNDVKSTKPILEARLKNTPPQQRGLLLMQIQRLLSRAPDKAAALMVMQVLTAPYVDLPEAHMALAQSAASAGDAERARNEAAIAYGMAPNSELAVMTAAQVAANTGAANDLMNGFLLRNPDARELRLAYARALTQQKDYAGARKQFDELYKRNPDDLTTLIALGLLNAELNDLPAAEKYLSAYIDGLTAHPDPRRESTQALGILAQISLNRNDIDGALRWLEKVQPGGDYLMTQFDRAQLEAKRGRLDEALGILHNSGASGQIDIVREKQFEAQLLSTYDRTADARTLLQDTLKTYPDNTNILYDLSMLADKEKQYDLMESYLRKIIAISPEDPQAYNALGYSLADRNLRLPEATELIEKAHSLAREDSFILDSLGWVKYRSGDLPAALIHLQAAWEASHSPEIGAHLGEVQWAQGNKDKALDTWRAVKARDPKDPVLAETLTRLKVSL